MIILLFLLNLELFQFTNPENYKRRAVIRKIIEGVIEGLPSTVKIKSK